MQITLKVNGQSRSIDADPDMPLLWALRDFLGLKGAKYGTTRDYVVGLQVVLPDGRIMRTGSKAMKSVSGYDLTRLFVGSEGTLGVVTEITLKINPKPTATSTALATSLAA